MTLRREEKAVNKTNSEIMDILPKADENLKGAITNIFKDLSVLQIYSRQTGP